MFPAKKHPIQINYIHVVGFLRIPFTAPQEIKDGHETKTQIPHKTIQYSALIHGMKTNKEEQFSEENSLGFGKTKLDDSHLPAKYEKGGIDIFHHFK